MTMTTMTAEQRPAGTAHRSAHVLCCPTRWSDVDENGHINNARLVGYIQEGIYDLFHHHAQAVRESLFPAGFLIARHEIDYLEQLHHRPEPLLVRLTVERLGRSSAHVRVDVCRDPFTYMTARTVVVARDRDSGRSRRLTPAERLFLAQYMTEVHLAAIERTAPPRITPNAMPQRQPDQPADRQLTVHQSGGQPRGQSRKVPAPRSGSRGLCRI
ncbi:acyl-CoA thioesterase FadM [Kitasatospora sp. GP30]|nr:acyl-CoA thioesterase FadM [Kitasatospora sp. GP30]